MGDLFEHFKTSDSDETGLNGTLKVNVKNDDVQACDATV